MTRNQPSDRAVGPLLTLALIFLAGMPLLFSGRLMVLGDIGQQFLPWEILVRRAFQDGRLPLWNSGALGGYPLLANLQSSPLYPIDLLLLPVEPLRFFNVSLLLHLLIAASGTYIAARRMGTSHAGASLAALAYSLSGFTMIHLPFGNHLTVVGASWIPWVFWGAILSVRNPGLGAVSATAAAAALQVLAGHPQMLVYGVSFASLYVLLSCPWRHGWQATRMILTSWVCGLGLAAIMAAAQLLPVLEWAPYTARHESLDFMKATEFGFGPHRLIALFLPDFFGSHISKSHPHWDHFVYWSNAYVGGLTVLLALLPLCIRDLRRRHVWVLSVVTLLALACACGRDNPLYKLVLMLPGFKHFRAPAKFLPIFMLGAALLGAIGLDAIGRVEMKRLWPRLLAGLIPVLAVLGVYGWLAAPADIRLARQANALDAILSARWLFLAAGAGVALAVSRVAGERRPWLTWLVVLTVGMDLVTYGNSWVAASLVDARSASPLLYPTTEVRWLQNKMRDEGYFRVATSSRASYANLYALFGLSNLSGYDPMAPAATLDLIARVGGDPPGAYRDDVSVTAVSPLLAERFVRYAVLAPDEVSDADRVVHEGPRAKIVEIKEWRADRFAVEGLGREATCRVVSATPRRFLLALSLDARSAITLPVTYAPGWRYTVGTSNLEVPTDNHSGLVGIEIPPGDHQVALRYAPSSIAKGSVLSGVGLLAWVALTAMAWRRRTSPSSRTDAPADPIDRELTA